MMFNLQLDNNNLKCYKDLVYLLIRQTFLILIDCLQTHSSYNRPYSQSHVSVKFLFWTSAILWVSFEINLK